MKFPFSRATGTEDPPKPAAPLSAPPSALKAQPEPGLVSTPTSGTPQGTVEIDPHLTRLRALRSSVLTAARMHSFELQGLRHKTAMLTLTYREVGAWERNHISDLLRHIRQWMKRRGHRFRYVWVAELQQRGALHYHVIVWLPRGLTLPKPDKQGWWPHGSTRIEWARKPVGYIAKYASKLDSKVGTGFPAGARLHGKGGLEALGKAVAQWYRLPAWAKSICDLAGRAMRRAGIGLVARGTGLCLPSPWRVSRGESGSYLATQAWSYVDALRDVIGPYSWLPGKEPMWAR